MSSQKLSIEVFRDQQSRDASVEIAEAGVEHVSRVTKGLQIVRTTRLLRIAAEDKKEVIVENIRWPTLQADMNIILTKRAIHGLGQTGHQRVGTALHTPGNDTLKVAIVDVASPDFPELVVAHELGHLFGLKKEGLNWDNQSHCLNKNCLMSPAQRTVETEVRIQQKRFNKWRERNGFKNAEYQTHANAEAEEFCQECATQLDKTSFFRKKAKQGQNIPVQWL